MDKLGLGYWCDIRAERRNHGPIGNSVAFHDGQTERPAEKLNRLCIPTELGLSKTTRGRL